MHIAIVGAGFTGTVLAVELLERIGPGDTISLIERRGVFGPGLAYSTQDKAHLLNVCAARMSARHRQPDHLVEWLLRHRVSAGAAYNGESFIPRWLFGRYLQDVLTRAQAQSEALLRRISDEVVDITPTGSGFVLHLRTGEMFPAQQVALCTGHANPAPGPAGTAGTPAPDIVTPWSAPTGRPQSRSDRILLVGTGLTMVDQVLSLAGSDHIGPITAISRRGRMHARHAPLTAPARPLADLDPHAGLRAIVRQVRAAVAAAQADGSDWRPLIDGVRGRLQDIWTQLSEAERSRALRHLRPFWESHRHRMAPAAADQIDALRQAGRLAVLPGRIRQIRPLGDEIMVSYRRRGAQQDQHERFDRVIHCTGSQPDILQDRQPLLPELAAAGLIRPGPLGLGVDVDSSARCLGDHGAPIDGLYALGPLTRGAMWEITAVGEIRQQCESVAGSIMQARTERTESHTTLSRPPQARPESRARLALVRGSGWPRSAL